MSTLERAIIIACEAHRGAVDKAGEPYILHPLRVMMRMDSPREMIAAVMHDVVEDNEQWTLQRLKDEGFEEDIVDAVNSLTKREGESYDEFIERASCNRIGIKVKIADLEDNMNVMRIGNLTGEDRKRIGKYHRAWTELLKRAKQEA